MQQLIPALIKARAEMAPVVKNVRNDYFKSRYADLSAILEATSEALGNNGLAVIQTTQVDDEGRPYLLTRLAHESGETIEARWPIATKDLFDPQKLGSALTYARRYGLQTILGLAAEDDDGNAAAGRTASPAANAPSAKQKEFAKGLLKEVRKANTIKKADAEVGQMFSGKTFAELDSKQISALIKTLEAEKKGF